jgi:hypothetical protein
VIDPFAHLGLDDETEEERRRREARERIERNLRIGAEQAARLDLPEPEPDYRRDQPGWMERQFQERSQRRQAATEAAVWGDTLGGLAELGALPGTVADAFENVPLPYNLQNLAHLVPEGYRAEARERIEAADFLRGRADTARQEAGMSPTLSVLGGVAAENPGLVAGGVLGGLKGARALGRAADLTGLIDDAVERGVRQGAGGLERAEVAGMRRSLRAVPQEATAPSRPTFDSLESTHFKGERYSPRMGPSDNMIVAKGEAGEEMGFLWYTREADGWSVRRVEVKPEFRRQGVATELYRRVSEAEGKPYVGSTAQTDQGSALVAKLRERGVVPPEMPSGRALEPAGASAASALPVDTSLPVDAPAAVLRVSRAGQQAMERAALPKLTAAAERAAFDPEGGSVGSAALGDWLRKNLRSFGEYKTVGETFTDPRIRRYFSEELPRRIEDMGSEEKLMLRQMQLLSKEVDQATARLAKQSGGQVTASQLRSQMDAARRTGDYTKLPPELQPITQRSGSFLDEMSQRYIDQGVIDEGMAETFRSNMGRYMHTSHAAFDRPGFLAEVRGTKAWDEARTFIKSEIPTATEDEVVGLLEALADRKQPRPLGFGRKGGVGRKDLTNLMRREEIPEPLRDLMGVYRDYRVNFERGAAKMAHTLAEHRLLKEVAEELEGAGVLRRPSELTGKGEAGFYREVPGGPERSPLAGYVTSPQVADLLQGVVEHSRSNWFTQLSGAVKFFKVASPQAMSRNFTSNIPMLLATGNLRHLLRRPQLLVESMQAQKALIGQLPVGRPLFKNLGVADAAGLEAKLQEKLRLGVIGRSASGREFQSYLDDIGQAPGGISRLTDNKAVGYASRGYMGGDDYWKWIAHDIETDRLLRIHGGVITGEAAKKEAAEIVAQTMQTYDRVMPLGRKLSRNPFTSPFATFKFEMPRNIKNIFLRGAHEFNQARLAAEAGDAARARRWFVAGMDRWTGVGAALLGSGAVATYINKQNGITGDKLEAMRQIAMPDYAQNSHPTVTEVNGDEVTYLDTQYADPYSVMTSVWVAAVSRPGDPAERSLRAAEEIARNYGGLELLTGTTIGQVANQDLSYDRPITRETRPLDEQIKDRAHHAWRGIGPGAGVTAERIGRAAAGDERYDLGNELTAVVGPRIRTINMREAFGYKVRDFNDARREISGDFTANSTNRDGSPRGAEGVLAAQQQAEQSWKSEWQKMEGFVVAGKNWGWSDKELVKMLTERKVRADLARALVNGKFMSYRDYRRQL